PRRTPTARPKATTRPGTKRSWAGSGHAAAIRPARIPGAASRPATIENAILTQERSFFQTHSTNTDANHRQVARAHGAQRALPGRLTLLEDRTACASRDGDYKDLKPKAEG